MHLGEEVFRTIRMSELEFSTLAAAFDQLLEEENVDVRNYAIIDRFLAAVAAAAGRYDDLEVVQDVDVALEDEVKGDGD